MSCCCNCHEYSAGGRRRGGIVSTFFKLVLLYVVLVFGAGTLINTGHPVAVESGKLIQVVTFINPAIGWADSQGWEHLAHGLRVLSSGVSFG
ncbi:MAG: hypothetical protein L0Y44_12575 [Phycisphaerales bacterium]|nr:hypothetical protein [Phycisphaerales bacterium]MCI0631477.1 hypothetical protein [Phycisphaerales bacterium]MCI0676189.1 hypothetical protein [Phycisphaerales bacterium]